ncbi:UNVERIFIED_CONTAM: hypothetical protein PYX00_009085 [Menopon gallinae]|uniref:Protein HGH1 homolog n=1 Tax=Menopon gallinae TaxID=328185 RepID=A0AAW2H9Z6_9NEOP
MTALVCVSGLTGSRDGCKTIQNDVNTLKLLIENVGENFEGISKAACLVLVNISATDEGAKDVIHADSDGGKDILAKLLRHVLDPESGAADAACMALSNLTRKSSQAEIVMSCMGEDINTYKLVSAFTNIKFNKKGCNLHYLAPFFSNLSQCTEFRRQIMNKNRCLIQKLLPFIDFTESLIRRGGIVATIRNCCFDLEYHDWLLSPEVDILPRLLLPLAGPEEFDDEDMDKLPLELQYLGDDKKREVDEDIRKLLLEALNQVCAKRSGREFLRQKNAYVILREYHKWEKDRSLLLACENVIDLLIRTEDEIGEDNLRSLEVPEEYVEKFEKMDKEYLKEDE